MKKIEKPTFTKDELDETKTQIRIGYRPGFLIAGYNFATTDTNILAKTAIIVKEQIDGTNKKRNAHEAINKFGWAKFSKDSKKLVFGVKYSPAVEPITTIGQSALSKYTKLLGYYLQRAGWENIAQNDNGDFEIKLNTMKNVRNLYTLSPSIGFDYQYARPDASDIKYLINDVKISALIANAPHKSR